MIGLTDPAKESLKGLKQTLSPGTEEMPRLVKTHGGISITTDLPTADDVVFYDEASPIACVGKALDRELGDVVIDYDHESRSWVLTPGAVPTVRARAKRTRGGA